MLFHVSSEHLDEVCLFVCCVLLLYAHEWHINNVLAFSHRETSHLPF